MHALSFAPANVLSALIDPTNLEETIRDSVLPTYKEGMIG